MKKYTVVRYESGNEESVGHYESNGEVARWTSRCGKYTASLTQKDDDFVYAWDHGAGKGRVRIPSHIIFDLPDLLTIMNAECQKNKPSGIGLFGETRIYGHQPIATLFPEIKD